MDIFAQAILANIKFLIQVLEFINIITAQDAVINPELKNLLTAVFSFCWIDYRFCSKQIICAQNDRITRHNVVEI